MEVSMPFTSARWLLGVALLGSGLATPGCSAAADDSQELTGADEEVATSADALSGNVAAGATLRTTTGLNLRSGASTSNAILLTMPSGAAVTVRQSAPVNGFYAVRYGTRDGWAYGAYLTTGSAPSSGSAVRITGPAVLPHVQSFANASCARYGCPYDVGTRVGHDPSANRAIDMMMSVLGRLPSDGGARGTSIANFGVANESAHRVYYVIWKQRINTIDGRGWRFMADRGSITQNHYDHVHVSFDP